MKFIDNVRFKACSLSNLVDNLTKSKDWNCFFEYESVDESLIHYKCLSCKSNYFKKIEENLKDQFENTFKISNAINKFILLLRKGVYCYEFMDDLEKFCEKWLRCPMMGEVSLKT